MPRSSRTPLLLAAGVVLATACTDPAIDDGDGGSTAASASGESGESGDTMIDEPDVPDNEYCDPVADWDPSWSTLEEQVLEITNEFRASGADCGTAGQFGPTTPLTMHPALRCSSRVHSADMAARNFFDHVNPSGEDPFVRMEQAGYSFQAAGENIAAGSPDAAGTVMQWIDSDGHCANIMSPAFTELGVGYFPGGDFGHLWTQNFGAPF